MALKRSISQSFLIQTGTSLALSQQLSTSNWTNQKITLRLMISREQLLSVSNSQLTVLATIPYRQFTTWLRSRLAQLHLLNSFVIRWTFQTFRGPSPRKIGTTMPRPSRRIRLMTFQALKLFQDTRSAKILLVSPLTTIAMSLRQTSWQRDTSTLSAPHTRSETKKVKLYK
jgi:hypothetical protein